MTQSTPVIVALRGPGDPLLLPWLDIYETSFPEEERVPVSRIIGALQDAACGDPRGNRFLAALNEAGQVTGMIYLHESSLAPAAFLWYFAVTQEARCRGLGSGLYQHVVAHLRPGTKAMIFDLEDPERMPSAEEREMALRRVAFYRRQGARMLGGIRYENRAAPYLPPLNLRVMVHPLEAITPREAFDCAKPVLAEAIDLDGEPRWE